MSTPPDLESLARRYVELWQDQMVAAASDPELTESLTRVLRTAGGGFAATAAGWRSLWPAPAHEPGVQASPGPAPTAPAPADRGGDLAQFALRLAALEERVATLESGPGRTRGPARAGSRRRKPG